MSVQINKPLVSLLVLATLLMSSCSTKKIVYMQDMMSQEGVAVKKAQYESEILMQPGDRLMIVVTCQDPMLSAMFNQPYMSNQIAGVETMNSSYLTVSHNASQSLMGYTIDPEGNINFPVLGKVQIAGMKRHEVADKITQLIVESNQAKDPVVYVEYTNLGISVIGEVKNPGRIKIDRERFNIFDAISAVGDMTIYGNRQNVTLIRKGENGDEFYKLDFTQAQSIYNSPAYLVKQGDVIYVAPNKKKVGDSSVNGNTLKSASFWVSVGSFATSAAVLINNLVKNK